MGKRVLVVRPDRIGDLVLSTPVFKAIREVDPSNLVYVLATQPGVGLIQGLPFVEDVIIYDSTREHRGLIGLFRLSKEIRSYHFDVAITLQSQAKVDWAVFFAGVPIRVGPVSKVRSHFAYNRGVRQRRSEVAMHEADYNLELLKSADMRFDSGGSFETEISVSPDACSFAKETLRRRGVKEKDALVLIHPGMGGSALNWPLEHYRDLIAALRERKNTKVVLSFGPRDQEWFSVLSDEFSSSENIIFWEGFDLEKLSGLLTQVDIVVAPSTGPLHMAVALGKKVVTFFPPIRVQSSKRWGPYRSKPNSALVLEPQGVQCGQTFSCRGTTCKDYFCMEDLKVSTAFKWIDLKLRRGKPEMETRGHFNEIQ